MRIVEDGYQDENGILVHISVEQWVTGSVGGRIRSPEMNRGPWTSDDNWKQTLEKPSLFDTLTSHRLIFAVDQNSQQYKRRSAVSSLSVSASKLSQWQSSRLVGVSGYGPDKRDSSNGRRRLLVRYGSSGGDAV
ncbi:hypothetical protein T4B_1132 [Trichinella pseudospiralis]|uniref:Uncharacterized protein n=2 Tax=Trichinella pseudospiralis TaxID=6337 RepID=A0A0V1FAD6_TRIPS|nr:hypothetical protein T4E_6328 [Trichinella pseudospiralis]KRY67769.1 hypothetical protein T4A_1709 [Trichinella pseudospiralis]KRY83101.1 hypothetical protein T4D_16215 [Trichinella pseudospiralis]KRZ23433.1 hypothetical protein T4B_1132 [Trichinella pseudospiralis]